MFNKSEDIKSGWRFTGTVLERTGVVFRTSFDSPYYAPYHILSFTPHPIRQQKEWGLLRQRYSTYQDITYIPDRLRWLRLKNDLLQDELAPMVGMTYFQYLTLETGVKQSFPAKEAEALAVFFGVPVTDFLDEYNAFLYKGQGQQFLAKRKELNISQKAFARWLGCCDSSVLHWEKEQKKISRASWEKYVRGRF